VRGPRLGTLNAAASSGTVDLGAEPPLMIGNEPEEAPIRRAVSLRWLSGTILTGLTSVFLMGGALMAALDNPNLLASTPESAAVAGADEGVEFGEKSDRIQPIEEQVSSRQILQVSTVTKQGERDFIKLRPFARIIATLATGKSPSAAAEVPPYDALRIFADTSAPEAPMGEGGAAPDDQIYGAEVDGEVSVRMSAFPADDARLAAISIPMPEVEAVVRASAELGPDETAVAAMSYEDEGAFIDEGGGEDGPFSALGVRIIPENVSSVTKTDDEVVDHSIQEAFVSIAKGQSFLSLLEEQGVEESDADQIIAALSDLIDLNAMHVGQKIRLAYAPGDSPEASPMPIRVSVYDDGAHQATVARADNDRFVRADEPPPSAALVAAAEAAEPEVDTGGLPRVYDAVYQTALEQQVPKPLIEQLIRIFAFDVDFQARIGAGDSIEVFHSLPDTDPDASEPEVLFATLTLSGVSKRFYRFRTSDDGIVDFYDEEGKSAKKFLMRKPMTAGVLRSGFGMRKHPILGYRRQHTGVDYAAPRGTPILAAGNGTVEKAGRTSGYGNFTLVKHTNGYESAYGHQSAFAKGIVPGARVRQGQIIGYVGSTGLSTGPHLHFEIRVNKSAVDPLRIRLPRGRVLEGTLLAAFEAERQRIDTLLGNPVAPATTVASVATTQ
jgi:murein DD-endopeptidase MepM/ murein hydrolase activator NlpD